MTLQIIFKHFYCLPGNRPVCLSLFLYLCPCLFERLHFQLKAETIDKPKSKPFINYYLQVLAKLYSNFNLQLKFNKCKFCWSVEQNANFVGQLNKNLFATIYLF